MDENQKIEKRIRATGCYYTETDRGRGYAEDYDITEEIEVPTPMTGMVLQSYVQNNLIEKLLIKKLGRDKYRGWQTCTVVDLPVLAKNVAPATDAPKTGAKAKGKAAPAQEAKDDTANDLIIP